MAELTLASFVQAGVARRVDGDASVKVRGIKHDSRAIEPGDLFAAVAGAHNDGAAFAQAAVAVGAVAVLSQRPLELSVPVVITDDVLVALCKIATLIYDDPTQRLTVVGITGTNGKTTTAYLLEALLLSASAKPAVVGTVNFRVPSGVRAATHTTPMADDLMRLAAWAVQSGATHLVLEVSSHGLAMHRVDGVHFEVAAFTNLTQDHLDYHADLASYEAAKRRLFTELSPKRSVINVDDPVGASIARTAPGRVLRCSKLPAAQADVRALRWQSTRQGITARVATPSGEFDLESPLIGEHNLDNLLLAIGCGLALGLEPAQMAIALRNATGAPGRLQQVPHPGDVLVFVDYAHTPDALCRVLAALRRTTTGRLIALFGCGGDRDAGKRPLMGKAAADFADLVVITSDNPRTESPEGILSQIEEGVRGTNLPSIASEQLASAARGYVVMSERRAAIRLALGAARRGDTVVLAGKGHEQVQIIGDRQIPFDDCVEAREAIAAMGDR